MAYFSANKAYWNVWQKHSEWTHYTCFGSSTEASGHLEAFIILFFSFSEEDGEWVNLFEDCRVSQMPLEWQKPKHKEVFIPGCHQTVREGSRKQRDILIWRLVLSGPLDGSRVREKQRYLHIKRHWLHSGRSYFNRFYCTFQLWISIKCFD